MTLNDIILTLAHFADTHPDLVHHTCVAKAGNIIELVVIQGDQHTRYILGAPL